MWTSKRGPATVAAGVGFLLLAAAGCSTTSGTESSNSPSSQGSSDAPEPDGSGGASPGPTARTAPGKVRTFGSNPPKVSATLTPRWSCRPGETVVPRLTWSTTGASEIDLEVSSADTPELDPAGSVLASGSSTRKGSTDLTAAKVVCEASAVNGQQFQRKVSLRAVGEGESYTSVDFTFVVTVKDPDTADRPQPAVTASLEATQVTCSPGESVHPRVKWSVTNADSVAVTTDQGAALGGTETTLPSQVSTFQAFGEAAVECPTPGTSATTVVRVTGLGKYGNTVKTLVLTVVAAQEPGSTPS